MHNYQKSYFHKPFFLGKASKGRVAKALFIWIDELLLRYIHLCEVMLFMQFKNTPTQMLQWLSFY